VLPHSKHLRIEEPVQTAHLTPNRKPTNKKQNKKNQRKYDREVIKMNTKIFYN
jgi:hypothetical protein